MTRLDLGRGRAVLLAGLILLSVVAGSGLVGTAAAENYQKEVTGHPTYGVIDLSEIDGEFTLKVSTTDAKGFDGSKLLVRETIDATNRDGTIAFGNYGAFEDLTLTAVGVSTEPQMGGGSSFGKTRWSGDEIIANTGGDRDFQCGLTERMGLIIGTTSDILGCDRALPGTTTVNSTELDANETKLEIYESAQTQETTADNWLTVIDNRLQDTETVSLVNHGRPAYIESLNEAGSKSAANTTAVSNITEYYSTMETNLYSRWNSQILHAKYLQNQSESQTGVSSYFIRLATNTTDLDSSTWTFQSANLIGFGTKQVTLQNGSSMTVQTATANISVYNSGTGDTYTVQPTLTPTLGSFWVDWTNSQGTVGTYSSGTSTGHGGIEVAAPTNNYEDSTFVELDRYETALKEIDSQTDSSIQTMATIVNQTYDAYEAGQINKSELITPATLMGNYEPAGSQFDGYAAATLASLGISQPENYSTIGTMNVSFEDGATSQGIIMAANNPPSGQWEVNQTYNPENITGSEFLVGNGEIREIEQNFTITAITNQSGGEVQNFTITERQYETTSANDLEKLYNQISQLRAEINARQSALAGGGGGISWSGLNGNQQLAVIVVGGLLVYGFIRD
jgi:hypothetical protein